MPQPRFPGWFLLVGAILALAAHAEAEIAPLDNPLLDFDQILVVKRAENQLGLSQNWQSNSSLPMRGYDNEIAALSLSPERTMTTVYRPANGEFVGDVDLHFDGNRMLFSMPGSNGRWQVFEIGADGSGLRELPLIRQPDVDNYDACYLPDGNIIFCSTAPFVGVPCVTGSSHVCNLYLLGTDSGNIRRLTFEQDHDWCPTVLNNGRILYLRWEYSDIPHFVSRILFHMNPDGTSQMEYYGSNSYWPNAMFYARPIPGSSTKFAAIVGGHHDVPRMGELVLFDTAKGRHEADGAIQRIPGRGKPVEPIILDGLVGKSWPKFLHPYPLSDEYFLVSAKPTPDSLWGIYLVDVFDNMTLIKEIEGYALFEPVPLRKTPAPPIIPPKVNLDSHDALVYMSDVYVGDGLKGVPRGTVKQLRLFTYHFAYHGVGGQINRVGMDGPWDIKRVIGAVPVEEDGSAYFRVPANTPISAQPLDEDGKALQLMRSWMTAMPGETLSCIGCHEKQNMTPPVQFTAAARRAPSEISPWYGPTRGFAFEREVQPVLDTYCIGCHDGKPRENGCMLPDFTRRPHVYTDAQNDAYNKGSAFPPAYLALRRYLRPPTIESDMHLLMPCEFHADTSELVQRLEAGHHGVQLTAEAWDRLITWIDLGAPAHGTWHEIVGEEKVENQRQRRMAMQKAYAGIDEDPEAVGEPAAASATPIIPEQPAMVAQEPVTLDGWPLTREQAAAQQAALGQTRRSIPLNETISLDLILIPPGRFVMGGTGAPAHVVDVESPFWMGAYEVTNAQFALFDPEHDSRLEHGDYLQFSVEERGYPLNGPDQPVTRVSWDAAMAFCTWLSGATGETFTLPAEAQWEYACRAGTASPLWFGRTDTDFAPYANLADASLAHIDTFAPWSLPSGAIPPWRLVAGGVNDGFRVSAPVGSFTPNPWGLHDMHGNAWEWTASQSDPSNPSAPPAANKQVVRGGSWYDRPQRATSAFRLTYRPWQPVSNVGFRVIAPAGKP